ncbi:XRE family transcriptional regulator [Campylobacter sp. CNRCH_2016_3089]|uniref:XRE family transcriptional regulator n=1 Tax=Campylobacter sp. CNRCH_2016_3089 TaxID=2911609 RepID=UPI0021E6C5C4|nr:XRE family transcriptional regulator [Campylobacter sp. CNRCH_2016_3089]MCV3508845.1 XRE family transcriptional regulator [Campylobacter sp. CNRCH_2016_3089]
MKNVDTKKLQDLLYSKFSNYQDFIQACSKKGYNPSLSTVKSWFNNNLQGTRSPSINKLPIIAEILNVPIEELLSFTSTNKNYNQIEFKYYPDVSASAGYGVLAQDINYTSICVDGSFLKEILDIPIKKSYDIIKINGDSMEPLLTHGDFVVIDRSKNTLGTISSADIVIFRQGEDLYCKKIKKEAFCDFIYLVSENKDYKEVKISDFAQCEIIGVVVSKMTVETFKNFIEFVR